MQLRDYQQFAVDSVYRYFEHNAGAPIVVVPTGGGKSLIIAALCRDIIGAFPAQRILILSHVKELIQQNYERLLALWPQAPAGQYSAGLGVRRPRDPITVASIQSVYRKAHVLGWRDLIFIDECHLLSNDSSGMYRTLIAGLKEINPKLKVVGFTATPYRLKSGLLTEGRDRLFTDIAVEIGLAELLKSGHIAPLVSKASVIQADLTGVGVVAGEFNARQAEAAMDKEALIAAALDEVMRLAADRRSWLFFCAGIEHARHVCDALLARGVTAACVTGETPSVEREAAHADFKAGRLRALVSVGVHTTGFDAPNIDLIVILRPTMSPGLWIQMLGRGLRTAPGKKDCLVLDYTDTTARLGPITHVQPPRSAGTRKSKNEHVPGCLICPKCRMACPLRSQECADCGHTFERPEVVKHDTVASELEVMSVAATTEDTAEWAEVDAVTYHRHEKAGKHPSLRVEYRCGLNRFSEWVCLAHPPGFALGKAREWWKKRAVTPPPSDIGVALEQTETLARPSRVRVRRNGKYWEVIAYDFEDRPVGAGRDADRAEAVSGAA